MGEDSPEAPEAVRAIGDEAVDRFWAEVEYAAVRGIPDPRAYAEQVVLAAYQRLHSAP